jgi:hypothetical protein
MRATETVASWLQGVLACAAELVSARAAFSSRVIKAEVPNQSCPRASTPAMAETSHGIFNSLDTLVPLPRISLSGGTILAEDLREPDTAQGTPVLPASDTGDKNGGDGQGADSLAATVARRARVEEQPLLRNPNFCPCVQNRQERVGRGRRRRRRGLGRGGGLRRRGGGGGSRVRAFCLFFCEGHRLKTCARAGRQRATRRI